MSANKMTKTDYIQSNKYLRIGFKNLEEKDLEFLKAVGEGKIDVKQVENHIQLKQVIYHMSKGMSLWELRGLYKAFQVLQTLPN